MLCPLCCENVSQYWNVNDWLNIHCNSFIKEISHQSNIKSKELRKFKRNKYQEITKNQMDVKCE